MPNRVRYDGQSERFYEVWYFIFNDPSSGDGYWIRYTLLNPTDDHPEAGGALWFARSCVADPSKSFAVKTNVPFSECRVPQGEFSIGLGESRLSDDGLVGGFDADGHRVAWNLRWEGSSEPHYFFGPALRALAERRNSVTVPLPQIRLNGTVTVDGEEIGITGAPGHEAHHWGTQRSPRWIWGHCCDFEEDPSAVVEMLSGQGPGGQWVTVVNLHTAKQKWECHGVTGLLRNRATAGRGFWQFHGFTGDAEIVVEVTVPPERVQMFPYVSPSYRTSECWNTQTGNCTVRVFQGTEPGSQKKLLEIHARGRAAAEIHDQNPTRIPYSG